MITRNSGLRTFTNAPQTTIFLSESSARLNLYGNFVSDLRGRFSRLGGWGGQDTKTAVEEDRLGSKGRWLSLVLSVCDVDTANILRQVHCMKAFVLSESENYWSGFLLDKDCDSEIVKRFFRGTTTKKDDDAETTVEAREECKTIVTSNERDFIRCIKEAQKREIGPKCEDCWGLVVLPNRDLQRKNALGKANIKNGLTFGGRVMPWKAIAYANLCIIVENEGRLRIGRFKRCKFCERDSPIKEDWYRNLPLF